MFRRIDVRQFDYQPAAVGTTETVACFNVKAGDRVLWSSAEMVINSATSTNSTVSLGDGDGATGYVLTTDIDLETSTIGQAINGGGTFTASAGGKLYTADDTVDATYTHATNGATNPKVRFRIAVVREK